MEDPKVIAAVISAIVSVLTVLLSFLLKSVYERHFHIFKLESEYKYDQRKKIKEVIAKYKTQLIDAAESLNHRLWNFSSNYEKNWHSPPNLKLLADSYYLASFTYRMLAFYAWIRKIEKEMIFLDSTVASKKDLSFVKYLKLFPQLLCDLMLFEGLDYNDEYAKDHFFKNDLLHMSDKFCTEKGIIDFSGFKNNTDEVLATALPMADFISGIDPSEDRLRWDRLQSLHFVLLMFLNTYGYDFQSTDNNKVKKLSEMARENKVSSNLYNLLNRYQLGKEKEVKQVLNSL